MEWHTNLDDDWIGMSYKRNFSRKQLVEQLRYKWNPNDFISKEVKFHDVLIEPYRVGILPALAGIYSRIHLGKKFNSLNEVHNHIAISNYYKFSIHDQKDVNPNRLRT